MRDYPTNLNTDGNWDFETGDLSCWSVEGDAFRNQPVRGDRVPTVCVSPVMLGGDYWDVPYPIGHHGDYWVGSAENALGDGATGTLTSQEFLISTRYIHFLVSGTQDPKHMRVELQVRAKDYEGLLVSVGKYQQDEQTVYREPAAMSGDEDFLVLFSATGHNSEIMRQETWDLEPFLRMSREVQTPLRARIKIIDASETGHINVDYFQFSGQIPEPMERPLWGFADLHCHPMAHLAFGGNLFWGKPTDPVKKLQRCDGKGHSGRLFGGYVLHELEAKGDSRYATNRHPTGFWPTWTSKTHQEMHIDWIRRAYEGGLRLMCACTINNQLAEHLMRFIPFTLIKPRDDLSAVLEQVEAIKNMADQQADWMAIAYSSAQARQIIRQGKLALVLAIVGADQLGGWKREQDCTDTQVARLVEMLYTHGLRMILPIHLADNAFGGTALSADLFNTLNGYLNGEYFGVEDGHDIGVQFRLSERPDRKVMISRLPRVVKEEAVLLEYLQIPPGHGHVNKKGLTERGKFLVSTLINKGMMIDIDHMSHRSVEDALQIAEQYDYPLIASRIAFRELACSQATEEMKTRQQVERIAKLGGVIGLMPAQGDVRTVNDVLPISCQVPNDCAGSAKSWAQAYVYAIHLMKGRGIALGTDFNGLAVKPRPRFQEAFSTEPTGVVSPGGQTPQRKSVRYAHYTRSVQAHPQLVGKAVHPRSFTHPHTPLIAPNEGTYDINLMGLAHYGMIPDFLQDGRNVGLSEQDLTPLFRSTNDFLAMWQKCECRSQELA